MRKTTRFDGAPWSAPQQDKNKAVQAKGRKAPAMTGRNMQRTGGRRGS